MKLTPAQIETLDRLSFTPDGDGIWWHDLPPGTRDVLLREKLIEQVGEHPGCCTPSHRDRHGKPTHPGYMMITSAGLAALHMHDARAGFRPGTDAPAPHTPAERDSSATPAPAAKLRPSRKSAASRRRGQ